jgi:Flp pilus assembly protein TadB
MLLAAVCVAVLCVVGTPWAVVAFAGVIGTSPPAAVVAAACAVAVDRWRRRQRRGDTPVEAVLLRSLAADLAAGVSLRMALQRSPSPLVTSRVRRMCALGASMRSIGSAMRERLPTTGPGFAVLMDVSDLTGGSVADALHLLAGHATEHARLDRERSVSASQAKFSALVVGVVPMAIAAILVVVRGVPEPGGAAILLPMGLGAAMMAAGAIAVFWMARRSLP